MSTPDSAPEGALIALREHAYTSYPVTGPGSTPLDEFEVPLLYSYPGDLWPVDATVIGCAVDPEEWPAWTDEVRFASDEEVAL
ncbi:MAG TPA: hypothetical protein VKA15_14970 [Isosphaeraceae bacterium]|nr:hypothetical protein [Isosphaeraceae bacterium]